MSERISWSMNVQVAGGPKFAQSRTREVEAFGKISVDVEAGQWATVRVVPDDAAGAVKLLLIGAGSYPGEEEEHQLGYALVTTAEVPNEDVEFVTLDAPQMLIGSGAVSLLGGVPHLVRFNNPTAATVEFTILVGGTAVVPPPE